jgi:hypothetical protein
MMRHKNRFVQNDRKINQKNKKLMMDKILSYNPKLIEGIEVYKDANRNFIFLIFLGVVLINFPLISMPCCILSMFFVIKMLQFSRYQNINNIVKKLAKDLSYKGIYDKDKAIDMLEDFRNKYGQDVIEYRELVNMINKYEALVTKIENVLRNINVQEKKYSDNQKNIANNRQLSFWKNNLGYSEIKEKQNKGRKSNVYKEDFDEKLSVLYRDDDGEIKQVNKAIEFFESENNESNKRENAVILKNVNKENKNLTVYLYKKASDLQKSIL